MCYLDNSWWNNREKKGKKKGNELQKQYAWFVPGGDSYMEQTGMLVGNFEFNP